MKIKKKVKSKYFKEVTQGKKRFEVRLADFKCKPGDTLVLLEQEDNSERLTGRKLNCEVLHKFNTKDISKFYSKKDIDKYGLDLLSIRKKFNFK
jgi:ASC-1-like (ASCH) protein